MSTHWQFQIDDLFWKYITFESQFDSFSAYNGVDNSKAVSVTSGQTYYIRVDGQSYQYSGQYKIRASF